MQPNHLKYEQGQSQLRIDYMSQSYKIIIWLNLLIVNIKTNFFCNTLIT